MNSLISFEELASAMLKEDNFLIFSHEHPDGDAIGSASGLCLVLRRLGKRALTVLSEAEPEYLSFLARDTIHVAEERLLSGEEEPKSYFSDYFGGEGYASVMVDCGSLKRIDRRDAAFAAGSPSFCLDHHHGYEELCDYARVEPKSASCAEIVFGLVRALEAASGKALLDKEAAEELYTGIITDTGNFQYSEVRSSTHLIAAELIDSGVSPNEIAVKIYQSNKAEKIRLHAEAVSSLKLLAGGRAGISVISQSLLKRTGALMEDTEGIVDTIRGIKGVELAVLIKEHAEGSIKVSFRSKNYLDVNELAGKFGGGGHIRAAGCTLRKALDEAVKEIEEAVVSAFSDEN